MKVYKAAGGIILRYSNTVGIVREEVVACRSGKNLYVVEDASKAEQKMIDFLAAEKQSHVQYVSRSYMDYLTHK